MPDAEFTQFLESHLRRVEPLSREINLAYWNATISGRESDFERCAELQVAMQRIYAEAGAFGKIRRWKEIGLSDPLATRQVDMLYNAYLRNQINPQLNERITKLGSKIENQFNIYRAKLNGRTVTSNDLLRILKQSNDSKLRKQAWDAGKEVGAVVKEDLLTLVKYRNEAAVSLGYKNYYSMSLALSEQDEVEINRLFDELEMLTREPFATLKAEMDEQLARRYGIDTGEILPWHYEDPFFQEAPRATEINLDGYFAKKDILDIVSRYYRDIGLVVDDIIARSDLYEKDGKDQHAYCMDIDRTGDIRILANIKNDETWVGTMLHELGHAVHDKYVDPSLPFLLRQEAHIFTTEAIAMMFGRLSKNAEWLHNVAGLPKAEMDKIAIELSKNLRLSQLVFARWSQVMMRFERELYDHPDQDLNELWWSLARTYQLLTPPPSTDRPHWASKNHLVSAPVYYHNYQLGEVLASQLSHFIRAQVLPAERGAVSFSGYREIGDYLTEKVFRPGARYRWSGMIEKATGEPLTPKYFVEEFVQGA